MQNHISSVRLLVSKSAVMVTDRLHGSGTKHRTGAEVMYSIVQDPDLCIPDREFIPDLWSRLENRNEESENRLQWEYLPGPAMIGESVTTLDFVNIAGRGEYIVASVKEDHLEIPVPIGTCLS